MLNKKFISFTYTNEEKYEKTKKAIKEGEYVEIHMSRGIFYGKIIGIVPEKITIEIDGKQSYFVWDSIDSITLVG